MVDVFPIVVRERMVPQLPGEGLKRFDPLLLVTWREA